MLYKIIVTTKCSFCWQICTKPNVIRTHARTSNMSRIFSVSRRRALRRVFFGLLLLLLWLAERLGEEALQLFVLQHLLGLDELRLIPNGRVSNQGGAIGEEGDREVESSDEGTTGGVTVVCSAEVSKVVAGDNEEESHDFVRLDQTVLDGLLETHARALLVLEGPNVERERASLLLYLREHSPRILHLELICHGRVPLEECRPRLFNASLGKG